MQFSRYLAICCFLASLMTALTGSAQLVEIPNFSEFGNSNNLMPFSVSFDTARYQQIYSAGAFPYGGIIDKINFRHNEGGANVHGPTDFDVQVAFAYAATTVGTASPVFSDNIGDDFTVVFDEVITRSYSGP